MYDYPWPVASRKKKTLASGKKRSDEHKDIIPSNGALKNRSELNVSFKNRLSSERCLAAESPRWHRHNKRAHFTQTAYRLANLSTTQTNRGLYNENGAVQKHNLGLSNSCSLELHYKQAYQTIRQYSDTEISK
jgi:hypothetical protein